VKDLLHKVVLSSRGQVVVPIEIRKRMGLRPGAILRVVDVDGKIIFVPESQDPIGQGLGLLAKEPKTGEISASLEGSFESE